MTCKESIENDLCLGCAKAEQENANADECKSRDVQKKIIEGVQMKI